MLVLLYGGLIFFLLFFVISFFSSGVFNKMVVANSYWASPYECGFISSSLSIDCFSFTYFSLLVFFVVFDLEISLLLNMPEQGNLFVNFYYYIFFIFILSAGFIAEVLLGYVRWSY
uniref:NADH-ubiquinone oxidoreductase chain 3 n=1 Tax=Rhinebothrium taeniuri TaxID=2810038 RepID=A0A8K1SWH4_9CEST|nr:NADH dehydrogenase subunit 3 [Rhinebothrium taeniuri]